jgi:uncharacterized protein YndB with AHSA1/START domain
MMTTSAVSTATARQTTTLTARGATMSDLHIVRDYPHPPAKVWRVLTEPPLMALLGMRPEGYAPVVGTRFRLVGKANPKWRGFVECEVLEARAPSLLRYLWDDDGKGRPTQVTYRLEPSVEIVGGTRLTLEHTGFSGVSGLLFTKLVMGPGWRKTLGTYLPAVLADVDDEGNLRPGSTLKPRF